MEIILRKATRLIIKVSDENNLESTASQRTNGNIYRNSYTSKTRIPIKFLDIQNNVDSIMPVFWIQIS
jgi:hypothetical protein